MKQKSGLRIESAEEVNAILKEVAEFTIRGLIEIIDASGKAEI